MKSKMAQLRMERDLEEIKQSPQFADLDIQCVEEIDSNDRLVMKWNMRIKGGIGSFWQNQEYDVQVQFGRQYPFEPPRLYFPSTSLNTRNIKHPLVGRDRYLEIDCVSKDNWNCTWSMVSIIQAVQDLFNTHPNGNKMENSSSHFSVLPQEPLFTIISYLPLSDIISLTQINKRTLLVTHTNTLWARLYYERCMVPSPIIYASSHPGPLREFCSNSNAFQWRYAREAFIRSHQCYSAVREAKIPPLETFAVNELAVLLPVAFSQEFATNVTTTAAANTDVGTNATGAAGTGLGGGGGGGGGMMGLGLGGFGGVQLQQQPPQGGGAVLHAAPAQPAAPVAPVAAHNLLTNRWFVRGIRYRALRSARLAQWLRGVPYIHAHLRYNLTGNIPVTTLQFLASLSNDMGMLGTARLPLTELLTNQSVANTQYLHSVTQDLSRLLEVNHMQLAETLMSRYHSLHRNTNTKHEYDGATNINEGSSDDNVTGRNRNGLRSWQDGAPVGKRRRDEFTASSSGNNINHDDCAITNNNNSVYNNDDDDDDDDEGDHGMSTTCHASIRNASSNNSNNTDIGGDSGDGSSGKLSRANGLLSEERLRTGGRVSRSRSDVSETGGLSNTVNNLAIAGGTIDSSSSSSSSSNTSSNTGSGGGGSVRTRTGACTFVSTASSASSAASTSLASNGRNPSLASRYLAKIHEQNVFDRSSIKLRVLDEMLANSSTHGHQQSENVVNFDVHRPSPTLRTNGITSTCSNSATSMASSSRSKWSGPDVYDFLEMIHEINIAFSFWFRSLQTGSIMDCLDSNDDWVDAVVLSKSKLVLNSISNPGIANLQRSDRLLTAQAVFSFQLLRLYDQERLLQFALEGGAPPRPSPVAEPVGPTGNEQQQRQKLVVGINSEELLSSMSRSACWYVNNSADRGGSRAAAMLCGSGAPFLMSDVRFGYAAAAVATTARTDARATMQQASSGSHSSSSSSSVMRNHSAGTASTATGGTSSGDLSDGEQSANRFHSVCSGCFAVTSSSLDNAPSSSSSISYPPPTPTLECRHCGTYCSRTIIYTTRKYHSRPRYSSSSSSSGGGGDGGSDYRYSRFGSQDLSVLMDEILGQHQAIVRATASLSPSTGAAASPTTSTAEVGSGGGGGGSSSSSSSSNLLTTADVNGEIANPTVDDDYDDDDEVSATTATSNLATISTAAVAHEDLPNETNDVDNEIAPPGPFMGFHWHHHHDHHHHHHHHLQQPPVPPHHHEEPLQFLAPEFQFRHQLEHLLPEWDRQRLDVRRVANVCNQLRDALILNTSPFLSFHGDQAGKFLRQFCETLEEEQKSEHLLSAAFHTMSSRLHRVMEVEGDRFGVTAPHLQQQQDQQQQQSTEVMTAAPAGNASAIAAALPTTAPITVTAATAVATASPTVAAVDAIRSFLRRKLASSSRPQQGPLPQQPLMPLPPAPVTTAGVPLPVLDIDVDLDMAVGDGNTENEENNNNHNNNNNNHHHHMTAPVPVAADTPPTHEQLYGRSIPILSNWPSQQLNVDAVGGESLWREVGNNLWRGSPPLERFYSPHGFARSSYDLSNVQASFVGYDRRFDESLPVMSARLGVRRSHTFRPRTMCMQEVGHLLVQAQDQLHGVVSAAHAQGQANLSFAFDRPGAVGSDVLSLRQLQLQQQRLPASLQIQLHDGTRRPTVASFAQSLRRRQQWQQQLKSSTISLQLEASSSPLPVRATSTCSASSTCIGNSSNSRLKSSASKGTSRGDSHVKPDSSSVKKKEVATIEVKIRCLWLASQPGGGIVRYRVPIGSSDSFNSKSTTNSDGGMALIELVKDFCSIQQLPIGRVQPVRIDMIAAVRYIFQRRSNFVHTPAAAAAAMPGMTAALQQQQEHAQQSHLQSTATGHLPGVTFLDPSDSLESLEVRDGDLLDLLLY